MGDRKEYKIGEVTTQKKKNKEKRPKENELMAVDKL